MAVSHIEATATTAISSESDALRRQAEEAKRKTESMLMSQIAGSADILQELSIARKRIKYLEIKLNKEEILRCVKQRNTQCFPNW